ncbi:HAD family hydrolase [Shouchella clausii]|uniref:HAD family hydrolase n=1 Tax=Shouchella clausii TaxID=79880 RepID=A0A268RU27_SHOCL|nr:HAD family hydrolase [Shouchella clausii]MBU8597292.1 HAD family hydrolase [Shouchella clausii]MED4159594.1 HAD family hydrolase [Shouchella clausii]MED4176968.1 HAD family hydrolase [Shouchella clausii]PAF23749.1 HAD family hydrolase [Shouchella clausii]
MNKQYYQVYDFQKKMSQPVSERPKCMDENRRHERYEYMKEELVEFLDAVFLVDQADAMIDLIYLALGTLVEMGVEPEQLFEIVHKANMSKLWEDGKPRLNEIGKIIKPPHFVAPEPLLRQEIIRQQKLGD